MSIFSELKCSLPSGEQPQIIAVSHSSVNPLLAVATYTRVLFYNDAGEKIDLEIERGITPTAIAWHPTHLVLAIGWQNGLITIWYGESNQTKEDANVHSAPIINITFNPNGHRMVTSDTRGTVAVWRNLSLMSSYQKEGPMTHCIFCDLNLDKNEENKTDGPTKEEEKNKKGDKKDEKKDKKKATQNLFFFGGKGGVVYVADDANHVTEVCKVSGAVKSLFFYEKMNSMIIITSTLLLVQFKISLNEKSQHDKKVKLSTAGDPEQLNTIWVGSSLLATVCAENLIRAWHLEKDENYLLTLAEVEEANKGGESLLSDKCLCIDYDEKNKLLVGGTKNGSVIFWKNSCAGSDSPADNEQWKCLPMLKMTTEPITQISIGKGSSMMAFKYASGVSVAFETLITGRISESMKVLQNSSKSVQVVLKNEMSQQVFTVRNNLNIRWIDCSGKNLIMWTGKKVEIYETILDLKEPKMNLVSEFPTERAVNLWLFKDNLIICQDYGIIVTSLQGHVKQTLSFPESEGSLKGSNRNNNFLVVYTINNYLRIYDLSRRELKQVGITRRFEDSKGPLGENIFCNVNCDGNKVSILATVKVGDSFQTSLFIYDVEVDTFNQHNFGE